MLNEKEMNVLIYGVAENDYNSGDCTKPVYVDSVEECCEERNSFVIISGLVKKGYLATDGDYVWLTNKGVKLYNETCSLERMVA